MPYCIVLTKEGSSHLISFVPRTWVKDSTLFWPRLQKKSDLELLRRDENSVPAQNWKKITCKIKVDGIDTISEALKLEELYSNFEDTEDEERYNRNRETNRKHPHLKAVRDDLLNLNEDFNLIAEDQEITMHKMNHKKTVRDVDETSNLEDEYNTKKYTFHDDIIFESNQAQHIPETIEKNITINTDSAPENCGEELVSLRLDSFNQIMSENSALSAENKILQESIQRLQNLEQETKRGFAVMQVQLDKLFNLLTSQTCRNNFVTVKENTKNEDNVLNQKNIEFPLKSVEQLDLLENELSDVDFEKVLVKKFSKISGTSGTHKIGKIGLQISKALFADELLSKFTWKGIKGSTKPPFMPYTNIRNCFYKIAHLADDSCTALEVDSFLQTSAIKHSGQRIKRKSCERIIGKGSLVKKKRTETTNSSGKNITSANNIKDIYNLNQEENQDTPNKEEENLNSKTQNKEEENLNSETPNKEEEENLNTETPNKEEVKNSYPKATNKKQDSESSDIHLNEKENEIDDDTSRKCGTKKCDIKGSKSVTVLSDVKIINKIMDLNIKSKAVNISSDNLSNSDLFD